MGIVKKRTSGVRVKTVMRGSPFHRGGLRKSDIILAINGEPLYNELDFQFFSADSVLQLDVQRAGRGLVLLVEREYGQFSGVTLEEHPIRRCANRCIFCFIDQMPAGLRRSLYVKDEDIRLSLLNGNYVTMSNIRNQELERIVRIGLSPLYISVHATDPVIRRRMLGNKKSVDIVAQLDYLAGNGITFHAQIVVCPSFNDGIILKKTVRDLLGYSDALGSLAVVPVGLTRFGNSRLSPIDRQGARETCRIIMNLSNHAMRHDRIRKVFLADEFFIKAGLPIPDSTYYESYPQIGNGIGLIRQMLDSCETAVRETIKKRTIRGSEAKRQRRRLLVTSVSAEPYIRMALDHMGVVSSEPLLRIVSIVNSFFGPTVTVAGLLTASDIIRTVRSVCRETDIEEILVPDVIFNYAGYTLDGFSADRIARLLGRPVRILHSITEVIP